MLTQRSAEKEQLDDLNLDGTQLHQALDGLSTINKYLGNTNATFNVVIKEIERASKPLTIVDLGCGGGDNLRAIALWAEAHSREVNLLGIDGNANALAYAASKVKPTAPVAFQQADILQPSFVVPACDMLISSHFVYHFSDDALAAFIQQASRKVSLRIVLSELDRSVFAYLLFRVGSIFLPFSNMVKKDGIKAIKRAFKRKELNSILLQSGMTNYHISRKWAFRHLVVIKVNSEIK